MIILNVVHIFHIPKCQLDFTCYQKSPLKLKAKAFFLLQNNRHEKNNEKCTYISSESKIKPKNKIPTSSISIIVFILNVKGVPTSADTIFFKYFFFLLNYYFNSYTIP